MPLTGLARRIESMWWRQTPPPVPLRWASRLYGRISRRALERRAARAFDPGLPLVSVGNVTVGGSGKTPFVLWLAEELRGEGVRPVILCRGDGGRLREPAVVDETMPADLAGDEAKLLAERSGCPVVAGRDRVRGARMACELGDVAILDDGFQYRQLARTLDVVLVPAGGLGNGALIPAGPLREPREALQRADLIVRTGDGPAEPLGFNRNWRWRTEPTGPERICGPADNAPTRCLAAAAIARPERFLASLRLLGVEAAETRTYVDHHRYRPDDVRDLLAPGLPVVVTGKDAVKLRPLWPADRPLWVVGQRPRPEEGLRDAIIGPILAHPSSNRRGDDRAPRRSC